MISEFIVAIGSLATGLGSFVAALVSARRAGNAKTAATHASAAATHAAAEVSPNHGSSMRDSIARIEDMVSSQGHQIGEIRRDAVLMHGILADRISEHGRRLERLED